MNASPDSITLTQALLTAISTVVGVLCVGAKILWQKSQECEAWRAEKGPEIEDLKEALGMHSGVNSLVNECDQEKCPFAGKMPSGVTFSIHRPKRA